MWNSRRERLSGRERLSKKITVTHEGTDRGQWSAVSASSLTAQLVCVHAPESTMTALS